MFRSVFPASMLNDPEHTQKAQLFFRIILSAMVLITIASLLAAILLPGQWPVWCIVAAGMLFIGFVSLWLAARGRIRLAAWLFEFSGLLAATSLAGITGGIQSPVLVTYPILIVGAGVVLSATEGLLAAALCVLLGALLALGEWKVWISSASTPTTLAVWVMAASMYSLLSLLMWISSRTFRRTIEQSAESERTLAGMARNVPGLMARVRFRPDGSRQLIYISARDRLPIMENAAEQDLEEVIDQVVFPEDRARIRESISAAARKNSIWKFEGRFLFREGQVRWLAGLGNPTRSGQDWVYDLILMDITDQKHVELALRESEDRLVSMMANLPGCFFQRRLDAGGTLEFASEGFLAMTGYAPADFFEKGHRTYVDLILDEDRAGVRVAIDHAVRGHRPYALSYRIRNAGGETRWFWEQGRGKTKSSTEQQIVEGYISDWTDQKQAEEKLSESEEQFRTLVENAPEPIFVQTRMRFAYLNPAAVRLFAAQHIGELLGQPVLERFHVEFRKEESERMRLLDSERIAVPRRDQIFLRMDGSPVDVDAAEVPITYEGEPGALVLVRDITERKRAESALRRRAGQLAILGEIGSRIDSVLDVSDVLHRAAELIHDQLGYHHVGIFLLDTDRHFLLMQAKAGIYQAEFPEGHRLEIGQGMVGWVAEKGERRLANNVAADPFYINLKPDRIFTRSELSMPIQYSDQTLGVLDVQSPEVEAFDDVDVLVMETLTSQLAVALENARLYEATQRELEERTRIETALLESEDRYRDFVANSAEGIWRYELPQRIGLDLPEEDQMRLLADGIVTESNDAMARIFGFRHAVDMVGKRVGDLLHFDDEEEVEYVRTLIRSGFKLAKAETRHIRTDGSKRWYEVSAVGIVEEGRLVRVWGVRSDITERKEREAELETIASLGTALRTASTRAEVISVTIDQIVSMLAAENATLEMIDPVNGDAVVEKGWGGWVAIQGERISVEEGLNAVIRRSGKPVLENDIRSGSRIFRPDLLGTCRAVMGAPIIARGNLIGFLWAARSTAFEVHEIRLLTTIADISANAIRQIILFEQLDRNLQRWAALHEIDSAISGTLDLQVSLSILVGHVRRQIHQDAVCVLMYNPSLQSLQYVAGEGFRRPLAAQTHLRMGEGLPGQATLERRPIFIADIINLPLLPDDERRIHLEGFVSYYAIPLIAKGQVQGVIEVFHRSRFEPDQEWIDYLETVAGQAAIAIDNARLFQDLQRVNNELQMAYDETIEGWSRALDLRDRETEGHTQRVTAMTIRLAAKLNFRESEIVHLRRGALLHDIGKMGVPDAILLKPGRLTEEEMALMRQHPVYAYQLLSPTRYLRPAIDIPYAHHEKWDGSGYPRGLKGDMIPLSARVFAVVDVWDAVTSNRPYRQAWPHDQALDYIRSQAGSHFDPLVVRCFLELMKEKDPSPD